MSIDIQEGTRQAPRWIDGLTEVGDDWRIRLRYFIYRTDLGLVSGCNLTANWTIDRPTPDVWPFLKDFNLWQSEYGHHYTGVIGDLEGKTFRISATPNDGGPHQYEVLKVFPEYMIVVTQPVPESNDIGAEVGIGLGRIPAGFHIVALDDYNGQTTVNFQMNHESLMAEPADADSMSDDEALAPWRELSKSGVMKWRDVFIPTLRKLVYEAT
jgi:hypothetical protein